MVADVVETKAEEVERIAGTAAASQVLTGDRCSSLHAPSTLRPAVDCDPVETKEWLDAFRGVLEIEGIDRARFLIEQLRDLALAGGAANFCPRNTPYINTIPVRLQPPSPGDADLERAITSLIRWNALCMVSQANEKEHGIGGHIATFASAAALYEVAFNHFFKGSNHPDGPDLVYFQGHASPGFYARAFLEGRLSEAQLKNFRRELAEGGGLSSYPHPWLMPGFWQFSTVSVGLGPIMAIYQARFNRYLEHRGLKKTAEQRVWAFLGDGECDEPEALAAISLAAHEKLDNLLFVINCNLQRLDGPVRGNGKIIQELEALFYGAGWNVIKVIWGGSWDALLEHDRSGLLVRRMSKVVDGEYQKYTVAGGAYIREHFFGRYPELLKLVEGFSDEKLEELERGGHDPAKVYAAYKAALAHRGSPTVILAHTVKGYGMGAAGEGKNVAHQQKTLKGAELIEFRNRFGVPLSNEQASRATLYRPPEDSPEMQYLHARRKELGGYLPARAVRYPSLTAPQPEFVQPYVPGSGDRPLSTTIAFVDMLGRLLKDAELGKWIVPIIPDEARTFGMDSFFAHYKIYSEAGQLYEPVDAQYRASAYRESTTGIVLEEGITESGAMSSFIAAGTASATHGLPMIPFFIYYSMFGFQRVGDLVWAAADMRARGFLLGGTAGRTTLNGEGLQHQDGHSHIMASTIPNLITYDPAFAYELAVILRDGIRRMYQDAEDVFYYITLYNENYPMLPMPEGVAEGILRGMYRLRPPPLLDRPALAHLLGSGPIVREALRAQTILAEQFGVAADVWSVTSYKELRRDALEVERWNLLHPCQPPRQSYVQQVMADQPGGFVAASDYVHAVPGGLFPLGTDGFGRSETRASPRRFFEVDAACIALVQLTRRSLIEQNLVEQVIDQFGVDSEKVSPMQA